MGAREAGQAWAGGGDSGKKEKKEREAGKVFFQRKMLGLSLPLTSDLALIKPPRAVGRGVSGAPDGPASLGPAPRRGGPLGCPVDAFALTSRHEVVPALDAGCGDGGSRGRRPGLGESRPEGPGEGTQVPSPPGPAAWWAG